MSEERLQEIKDSVEFQYTLAKAKGPDNALLFTDEEKELIEEVEKLKKELEIYKLRHKLALKKLNSAIRHYDTDKENNAIIYTKQILEGQGIEEKCRNMLRGDKE